MAPNSVPLFSLSVNKAGAGQGRILSDPARLIRCEAICTTAGPIQLESGTTVTLVATAANGHQFDSWTGCDSLNGDRCTVVMNGNRTPTATFSPMAAMFTLMVEVNAPTGSISSVVGIEPPGSQILCRVSGGPVCNEDFAPGTVVILGPDSSSLELGRFTGWVGCDSLGPLFACTVTMTDHRTVLGSFSQ